jgi:hypothetical protein
VVCTKMKRIMHDKAGWFGLQVTEHKLKVTWMRKLT